MAVSPAEAPPAADTVRIPGGKGKAVRVKKGDKIKITNLHGTQVGDRRFDLYLRCFMGALCSTLRLLLLACPSS